MITKMTVHVSQVHWWRRWQWSRFDDGDQSQSSEILAIQRNYSKPMPLLPTSLVPMLTISLISSILMLLRPNWRMTLHLPGRRWLPLANCLPPRLPSTPWLPSGMWLTLPGWGKTGYWGFPQHLGFPQVIDCLNLPLTSWLGENKVLRLYPQHLGYPRPKL